MKYEDLLSELKKHDFKYENYVHLAVDDFEIREKLIANLIEENHINIYFNSYHLINEASKIHPASFYQYWENLVPLLNHKNSYHRSISHWILTNLIQVDTENKFDFIKEKYFSMIKDMKFGTGYAALKDIMKISEYRFDLREEIIDLLLNKVLLSDYKKNQIQRMQYEIMDYLSKNGNSGYRKEDVLDYIKDCLNSENSKNKRYAKSILKRLMK